MSGDMANGHIMRLIRGTSSFASAITILERFKEVADSTCITGRLEFVAL